MQLHEGGMYLRVKKLPLKMSRQLLEIMKRLLPDDVATAEDIMDIALAREELTKGEAIDFNDIDWS